MKTNKISWVLIGVRPKSDEKIEEKVLQKILNEAFDEERVYHLFLCGNEIDKTGSLEEMEEGFKTVSSQVDDYKEGDYCIISKHEDGDLLFLPTIIENDVKKIGGNINNM